MTGSERRSQRFRWAAFLFVLGIVSFAGGAGVVGVYRIVASTPATPTPTVDARVVENFRVALATLATPVAGERVAWSSSWSLCWDPLPGALGYEVQAMTSESASARLKRVEAPCFTVELAAGEDRAADVPEKRAVQLAVQRSQLAYRVRAIFGQNVVGTWSPAIDAGAPGIR